MFETAELGQTISKRRFDEEAPILHTKLLALQRRLKAANIPVVIIVSGVEGAGKGEVVNRLNKWFDARGLTTYAFWDQSDEERERPPYWRFWRAMPARGTVGILFGSWYTDPIIKRVFGKISRTEYDAQLMIIAEHERMLTDDGALFVKLWFHLPKKAQKRKLEKEARKEHQRISPLLKQFSKSYDRFAKVSERAIRMTDHGACPWHIIEATDKRYRDLTVGHTLLEAVEQRLAAPPVTDTPKTTVYKSRDETLTILSRVNPKKTLSDNSYRRILQKYQRQFYQLAWLAKQRKCSTIAVFEGWDASGKGGAIRRLTAAMDARLFQVISIASPTDEEKAHHYLWRFWRHIPRGGHVTIYDRSWYGRVLVERVEKLADELEWKRAYREINAFEEQLRKHGLCLVKFWLHIDKAEQLRRFKEREKIAWKQHKITDEDWRNREQWDAYESAVDDMIAKTSTDHAPWTLIPGNDKKHARIEVVKTACRALKKTLS